VSGGVSSLRNPLSVSPGSRSAVALALQALLAAAALALAVLAVTTQGFFTVDNGRAILASLGFVGILAVGMTVIMISGAFASLSLGLTAAVTAMFFLSSLHYGIAAAILMTIALGTVIGAVQGAAIGGWGANPIILTIAAGSLQEGVTVAVSSGGTVAPTTNSYEFLNETLLGVPASFYVLLALVALVAWVMRRTNFGREVFMVGDNREAARAAGLRLGWIGTGVFGLAGATAALTGILLGAYNQSGSLLLEGSLTYDAIAATLVGGAAIAGGRGSIWRTLLGAMVIATITDLLLLRGYSTGIQIMVKGLLVLMVVVLVHVRRGEHRR
jgi:ribose transport system permease protein